MGDIRVEFSATIFPEDHPGVIRKGREVLVEPFGTRELVLAFEDDDAERWAKELLERL